MSFFLSFLTLVDLYTVLLNSCLVVCRYIVRLIVSMSGGKRNPELDKEAQQWIEAVIGEKFPSGSYDDALKDGIILCK